MVQEGRAASFSPTAAVARCVDQERNLWTTSPVAIGVDAGVPHSSPGHAHRLASPTNPHEQRLQWVVSGSGPVQLSVDFQRGGKLAATVELVAPPSGPKL